MVARGHKVIYLGASISLDHLRYIAVNHSDLAFVTYFTVRPAIDDIPEYFEDFNAIFGKQQLELYVLGTHTQHIDEANTPHNIKVMMSIREFVNTINSSQSNYA